jgi:hypothetical protein
MFTSSKELTMYKKTLKILLFFIIAATASFSQQSLDQIAERYVKLALQIGTIDSNFVDAYYGPPEWKPSLQQNTSKPEFTARLRSEATILLHDIASIDTQGFAPLEKHRHKSLQKQIRAMQARLEYLSGVSFTFDEESRALYDAVAPRFKTTYYDSLLAVLDSMLPGSGTIAERLSALRTHFLVARDKIDPVIHAALNECRKRTRQHIPLPNDEQFKVEYVMGKSWGAYNWYKGNRFSIIQINLDSPFYINRAVSLAAHEGYPGHHVYNLLLEDGFYRQRGWVEYSIYLLFSPQSLIAEGTANYAAELLFSKDERVVFEKNVLCPLAGLDTSRVEEYHRVLDTVSKLSFAGNDAARGYLDGTMSRDQAMAWLQRYLLVSPQRAAVRMNFIRDYRSYVINYNVGEGLISNYIKTRAGAGDPDSRWRIFTHILTTPMTASDLMEK